MDRTLLLVMMLKFLPLLLCLGDILAFLLMPDVCIYMYNGFFVLHSAEGDRDTTVSSNWNEVRPEGC